MSLTREDIEQQLARILAFRRFASSPRMSELLAYLVKAELSGEGDRLKGYSIGVDVFDRMDNFDPSTDSIVRVQTGRLRQLLKTYYLEDGAYDRVRITIPKGQYQPEFSERPVEPGRAASVPVEDEPAAGDELREALPPGFIVVAGAAIVLLLAILIASVWFDPANRRAETSAAPEANRESISLAVLALHNTSVDASERYVAEGLRDELVTTLSRVPNLNVSSDLSGLGEEDDPDIREIGRRFDVDFVLRVNLQREDDRFRANIQLVQTSNGDTIWAEMYDRTGTDVFDVQDEIVISVATELRPQLISAAREAISQTPTSEQTAWELYLQSTWTPGATVNAEDWQRERVELAERALAIDPDFGPAHSVLADKYAFLANIVPELDTPEVRARASEHALRAVELAGEDADAMFNVANHFWHMGNYERSQAFSERVLELDPSHPLARFLSFSVPYTCRRTPPDILDRLFEYDSALSTDNPVRWVTLTWIAQAYVNDGDYENAVKFGRESSQIYRSTDSTLRLAATLVQIGENEEAISLFQSQKMQWPSINAHHFAEHTIARRCAGEPLLPVITSLYMRMADVVEAGD